MQSRGVHLGYGFQPDGQRGADVQNPLFDLLSAVREHGSIQHAAKAMGASYRHVWGALKHWEGVLGEALVTWTQGQPARLLADALDGDQQVLTVFASHAATASASSR
jgi:putative molybdopterin biosynthesis protein